MVWRREEEEEICWESGDLGLDRAPALLWMGHPRDGPPT